MPKDKIITLKGKITITSQAGELLYENHNDLQPYADIALLNMLAGNVGYNPNSIGIYAAGVNVANELISQANLSVSSLPHQITYVAFVDAADFSGPIDTLQLQCTGGVFSIASVSYTKPADISVYISWIITTP